MKYDYSISKLIGSVIMETPRNDGQNIHATLSYQDMIDTLQSYPRAETLALLYSSAKGVYGPFSIGDMLIDHLFMKHYPGIDGIVEPWSDEMRRELLFSDSTRGFSSEQVEFRILGKMSMAFAELLYTCAELSNLPKELRRQLDIRKEGDDAVRQFGLDGHWKMLEAGLVREGLYLWAKSHQKKNQPLIVEKNDRAKERVGKITSLFSMLMHTYNTESELVVRDPYRIQQSEGEGRANQLPEARTDYIVGMVRSYGGRAAYLDVLSNWDGRARLEKLDRLHPYEIGRIIGMCRFPMFEDPDAKTKILLEGGTTISDEKILTYCKRILDRPAAALELLKNVTVS